MIGFLTGMNGNINLPIRTLPQILYIVSLVSLTLVPS